MCLRIFSLGPLNPFPLVLYTEFNFNFFLLVIKCIHSNNFSFSNCLFLQLTTNFATHLFDHSIILSLSHSIVILKLNFIFRFLPKVKIYFLFQSSGSHLLVHYSFIHNFLFIADIFLQLGLFILFNHLKHQFIFIRILT